MSQEASSPAVAAAQPASSPAASQEATASPALPETVAQVAEHNDAVAQAAADTESEEEAGGEDEPGADDADEGEANEAQASTDAVPNGPLYTSELSDEKLTELWKKQPTTLGSISVGFVESGRMVNSVRVPQGDDWIVVSPELAYGTQETVDYVLTAIREVRAAYPKAPPLRVNQISSREGGFLRPHKSHQNGRDVDLGFYYPTVDPIRARERERYIDLELNWALLKSLATHTDVQMILVDKRVQKVLYDYALRQGESKEWLDSLFNAGPKGLIKHARGHRDHFHVRFFNPRAQELGRRIAPLLALQPDKNIQMHRVRSGDTLGGIALRYGSSINGIKKANRMRNTFLRLGQVLAVPLRGPCTRCPVPPPLVVPPRRMPPGLEQQAPAVAAKPASVAAPAAATPAPAPEQPAVAAQQTPAAATEQPAVAAQQAPAPAVESQPAVSAQPENTGGSAPASADTSTETKPQTPDTSRQEPSGMTVPAGTHSSASIVVPAVVR
ncbi:penicillin-insensitive murein endopeptidase [Archangium sp.]|uniref:LysM peptidoglycan-binding domain-containing protein n=1 Tax=Archangium sp. TaxID=1872627 RepID=UPI00389A19B0